MSEQAVAFLNSGVTLAGSPLAVIDSTRRMNAEEVDALGRRGARLSQLYRTQGSQIRSQGRAALLGQEYSSSSQALQYKLAENRQFGASAYGLINSIAGTAARPLFARLFQKSPFGTP